MKLGKASLGDEFDMEPYDQSEVASAKSRLLANTIKLDCGCWEWTGVVASKKLPYGVMRIGTKHNGNIKSVRVHRLAFALSFGTIKAEQCVCHTCDNCKCVNPAHLFLGSRRANSHDAKRKNRTPHSEKNGMAKLTTEAVVVIKSSGRSAESLAAELGVSRETIWDVRKGKTWKRVSVKPDSTSS